MTQTHHQTISRTQALENGLIEYFLGLLESPLTEVDKPSATKALIAESLKAMTKDIANGERVCVCVCVCLCMCLHLLRETFCMWSMQVAELLEGSAVWATYKDQKHDLFITSTPTAGYLTGAVSGVAGYLTAGTGMGGQAAVATPPPLKEPPDDPSEDK